MPATAHRNGNGTTPLPKTGPKTGGRFAKGADARRGGGKAGRSGRKPDAFLAECKSLADGEVLTKVRAYLRKATTQPDDPWFWKCADYVTNYGRGKPPQTVTVGGEDGQGLRFTLELGEAPLDGD